MPVRGLLDYPPPPAYTRLPTVGGEWPRREEFDAGDARALARRAVARRGDPGRLCGAEPGRAGRRERPGCAAGCCSPAPPCRSRSRSGRCISSPCWRRALPFPVDYLVLPTLLSFLVCVIVVGAAVFADKRRAADAAAPALSAGFMGVGIVSMHYIGMAALHASAHMIHAPLLRGGERGGRDRRRRAWRCGSPPAAAGARR